MRTPMDRSGQEQSVAAKRPRRSVQSKLSFSICSEACGPRTATAPPQDTVAEDGGSNSEGREKKDKRKRNDKLKSQDGAPNESADNDKEAQDTSGHRRKSSRILKNKLSGSETPRKNRAPTKFVHPETSSKRRMLNGKSDNVKDSDAVSQPCYDLWSEAKKAAEENLRLFAGKQAHPFFSICRATKKSSETKNLDKSENRSWLGVEGDYCISFPPFHVFDTVQDDVAVPNWENWNFLETCLPKLDGYCSMNSSVFEVLTKSLILEAACGKDTNMDGLLVGEKMNATYKTTSSSKLSSELPLKEQLSSPSEMVDVGCIFSWSSVHGSIADDQCQNKLQNGRLASYFKHSISCADNNLWTDKYRPEISLEVCGNAESVKLLSEWLKSWQERVVQNIPNGKRRNHCIIEDSEDNSYDYQSDVDEIECGDPLKNVLLITGPVGCGKSAAIYACARDQGFKVNASSLRNGAFMRQTFGEGVDSLGLTHWLAEEQINQEVMDVQELQACMPVFAENGLKADSSLLSTKKATEKSSHYHIANKTLLLFEEVDVVFDEDHGFISTIFKLAETTKRPIVLTSNTKQPVLPHLLDRLVLDFKAPSYSELLDHASMICNFEKVRVSHSLLEHIVKAYAGDVRRILMLLQFWCQGFRDLTEERIPCTRSLVPFDIDAVHLAIPQIIPWDLRCELSEMVEEEISKAVFALEQKSIFNELLQHNINSWEIINPLKKVNATTSAKGRKKGKLRKQSIIGHTQFSDHMNHLEDLYDSDSPSTCFQRIAKKKRCVVLSSESDDGLSSDEVKPKDISPNQKLFSGKLMLEDASAQANGNNFLAITNSPTSRSQEIYGVSQLDQLEESRNALGLQNSIDISEVASTSHICDTSRTQDPYMCMSESSFIFGTETMNFSVVSPEISHNSGITNLFDLNISPLIQAGVGLNNADVASSELSKCLENDVGTTSVPIEVLQRSQEIGCFQNEEVGMPSQYQLVDDCSHPDFIVQSIPKESTACSPEVISISKTWRRLQTCQHENLKLLSSNSKDVSLVSRLTSGLADLISEADIMFRSCNPIICDNLEPTSTPCVEPDSFSWYDEQVEMGSTFAQHGLCFYTMKLAAVGSCLGCNNMPDLAQEILASSSGSTALGKLLTQEIITQQYSSFKDSDIKAPPSLMPFGRESAADFYSAILPIVPERLSLILKGVGFHEYLQFIGQISRFECSQLAESLVEKQKRRSRTRMHYLSSGANQLSSGQAELLAQRTCFTRSSSRY